MYKIMKDCRRLFEIIDSMEEEYIARWADLCALESPSENKTAVDAAGEYLCRIAAAHGWKTDRLPLPLSGDPLCFTMNPDAAGRPAAFSGHIDTVHPIGSFGDPPVRIAREEDRLYGPGAADCKGGVIAALYAMAALERVGFTDRPVMLLIQTDEEISSRYSKKATINWLCEKAADTEAFLNVETHGTGKAVLRRKGIGRYRFTVTGKAVHAANCDRGVSAIREAAAKILELEQYKDPAGITCSCGLISGGTTENSVPETCVFTADIRFTDTEQMNEADRIIRETASRSYVPGSTCVLEVVSRRLPMEYVQRNYDLLGRLNEIYRSCGLTELTASSSKGGSDAADVTRRGIPCIDSLGVCGKRLHSRDEYGILSSLAASAKMLAAAAYCL